MVEVKTQDSLNIRDTAVDNESQKSESQVINGITYVHTFDGHPSEKLRDVHNSNLLALIFATILSIFFFFYYVSALGLTLFAVFGTFVPLALNYTWLGIDYEHKLRSIRNYNAMIALFVVIGLLACFQFGLVIYVGETMFSDPLSTGGESASYQVFAMWVTENLFCMTVSLCNMW